jgi:exodeoxyribonuclease VII large subunit
MAHSKNYITVSDISNYLKKKFDSDEKLQNVYLRGEISNFKAHSRGHFYFSLKDDNAKIDAIMFSSKNSKITFRPKDGDEVEVFGQISIYPQHGKYQIYVDNMKLSGTGQLFVEYEKLKQELATLGYFAKERKQKLPKTPNTVGIVTASTGAAIRDIVSTIQRRYPIASTILAPAIVQGPNAKNSIVKAIEELKAHHVDVIIVGRGGGSIEDLWAFNERVVADAIYNCHIPIISAVGHETDFTIADFVADMRAPTPTGAAEMAVPDYKNVITFVNDSKTRLINTMTSMIDYEKKHLKQLEGSRGFSKPVQLISLYQVELDSSFDKLKSNLESKVMKKKNELEKINRSLITNRPDKLLYRNQNQLALLEEKLKNTVTKKIENSKRDFQHKIEKLDVLNPLNIMKRGYSVTYKGLFPITSVKDLTEHDQIKIVMQDGKVSATVNHLERSEEDGK